MNNRYATLLKSSAVGLACAVAFMINARAQTVIWDGSTDTNWSASPDTTSWGGGVDTTYNDGDAAQFNGAGSTVNITGAVSPGSISVNDGGTNYSFTDGGGEIQGTAGLTKDGTGTLTLYGANTYTGGTDITGGTLEFQNNDALGTGLIQLGLVAGSTQVLQFGVDALNLPESVRIQNSTGNKTIRLDLAGTNTGTLSGTLDIRNTTAGEFDIDVGADDTLTVNNAIITGAGGGAGLTKEGDGTLQIHDQSSYLGLTTVNGGTLVIANPTGTSRNFGAGNININNGATLQTAHTGGGQVRLQNKTITFDATGGGTINIDAAGTRVGGTTIVTTGGSTSFIIGGLLDLATLTYNVADGPDAVDLQVSNSHNRSGIVKNGDGTLRLTATSNNLQSNPIDINAGVLELGGAGRLVNGNYSGNITNDGIFRHNSTNNQTLNGVISGTGALEKDNTSTLTLTGTNTYTGDTAVNGGTLNVSGTYTGGGTITAADGTTFQVTGGTIGDGTNNGDVVIADGGLFSVGLVGTVGGVSTAEIDGTLSFQEGSIYRYTINSDGANTSDSLTVNTLDLADTPITISITEIGLTGDGDFADTWTLFTFDGATAPYSVLTEADFNIVSGPGSLIAGTPDIYWDGGTNSLILTGIQAVNIPEPSSLLLLGLGAALLRRRMVRQALRA